MDRFFYHYIAASRILKISVESGVFREDLFLGADSHWEPPSDQIQITPSELVSIRQRVSDALKFMSIPHQILSERPPQPLRSVDDILQERFRQRQSQDSQLDPNEPNA
jgi:hypothetical protein